MINQEELKRFIEYIQYPEEVTIGINISPNQVESSIVWYSRNPEDKEEILVAYGLSPSLRVVTHWNYLVINKDILDFFKTMKELEHQFCVNHLGDVDYDFFDYAKDIWRVKH